MDNFINWFTNKKILIISLIGVAGFLILAPKESLFFICDPHNLICIHILGYIVLIFMIGLTIFIPALILFFLNQEVFKFWRKTLFIYIIIYLFIIITIPWYAGDGFFHIQKDFISAGVSILYFIISLIIILYKSFQKE